MKKIYLMLLTTLLFFFGATVVCAQTTYYSNAAGTDFNNVSSWGSNPDGTGTAPASISTADSFVIQNNAALSLSANAAVRYLVINAGSLTVAANTLTVEVPAQNNSKIFVANGGQLNLTGGTIIVNGAIYFANGSGFTQSGGLLQLDPNSGTASTSIGSGNTAAKTFGIGYAENGTTTSTISSGANVAKFQISAGTIQIIDPPLTTSTTAYSVAIHTGGPLNLGTAHTFKFGDGVSTEAAGSANGYYIYLFPGSSYGILGNVEVDVLTGTNRWVKTTSSVGIQGNLNIVSGEFWNTSTVYVNGNVSNNGIFTNASTLYFGNFFNASATASTNAQVVSGSGVFRNSQTTITANSNSITVNNTNANGVTLLGTNNIATQPAGSFSISSTLTFTAGKLSTTGSSVVLGVSSGTPSAGTLNVTSGGFSTGTNFGRSWTTSGTGTAITAGTDPTTNTSRYPFITSSGAVRSAWIQRVSPTAAGIIFTQYNEIAGTSSVSIADGAYTVNARSNDNWVISSVGAEAGSYTLAIIAPGVYPAIDNNTRIVRAADVIGTYQQGTITPGGQRTGLLNSDLNNVFYLGVNLPSCLPPNSLITTGTTANSGSFSWTAPTTAPSAGYQYYVNTTGTAPDAATVPTGSTLAGVTNATAGGLSPNVLHYYWVRSDCGGGDFSPWTNTAGTFITGYCVPASTSTATYINNFSTSGSVTNISNLASGLTSGGYQDNYNTISGNASIGGNIDFSLDFVGGTLGAAIWIDFNKNQLFESSEFVYSTTGFTATGQTNISGSISIPGTAVAGEYRMRVLVDWNTSGAAAAFNPCGFGSAATPRGEVEDYKIILIVPSTDAMDWVNLQFPGTATIPGNSTVDVYTQGYEAGVTEPQGTAGAGITVWVGTNSADTDPATWPSSAWVAANFNAAQNPANNNDEYVAAIGNGLSTGTYYYASRWQLNGGPYRYGGFNATGGGFWDGSTNVNGILTVTAPLGSTCANPIVVSTYPYNASSTTCGSGDDYGTQCSGNYGGGEDLVYQLDIPAAGTYNISVTATGGANYIGWFLKDAASCATGSACLANAISGTGTNAAADYLFTASGTFYLIVDTWPSPDCAGFNIAIVPILCTTPTSAAASSVTSSTANANWTPITGNFIIEYGPTATFTPTGTGAAAGNANNLVVTASNVGTIQLTGLTAQTGYSYVIRQDCTGSGNGYSANSTTRTFTTLGMAPANDNADGAIEITVNAGCSAAPYTNVNATQAADEKFASCFQSATTGTGITIATHTVWFKFEATSTAVRVTTDITGGTLNDTHLGLFSVTNSSDYNTFTIISCDDDNGVTGSVRSTLYATGLSIGQTYYVSVDGYNGGTGTFCLAVDNLSGSMLSTTNTCATTIQTPSGSQTSYAAQVPIVDGSGNLVAIVRNPAGGSVSSYLSAQNINTGAIRQSAVTGNYYLDRNFRINNSSATNVEVQFFFLASELATLNAANGTTLGTLAATRQDGTACQNNFVHTNGAVSLLSQTANGTSSDGLVNWIQVTTPGFSNFYLNNVGQVLPISIEYFRGTKQNNRNVLDWKVNCTGSPSVTLILERSSDGRTYEPIHTSAESAARCLQPFSQNDLQPLPGLNYYRLKTVDIDAKIGYSNVVVLMGKNKGFELITLAPNPVKTDAVLTVTSAENTIMEIVIRDINGKHVSKQRVSLIAGSNQVPISMEKVAAGVYTVSGLTADGAYRTLRFVKQ